MTMTLGLCGAALLVGAGWLAFRFLNKPAIEETPAIVRIPRKNRPARKPNRDHIGRRGETS